MEAEIKPEDVEEEQEESTEVEKGADAPEETGEEKQKPSEKEAE